MSGFVRVGPNPFRSSASIEIEVDGERTVIHLDEAHAAAIAKRINECLDGTIAQRAPSRRVLEIEFKDEPLPEAVGGN